MKERLDQSLVSKGFCKTRSQAQLLIKGGKVKVNEKIIKKTGHLVSEEDKVIVKEENHYVSRGAYKLKAAIEEFGIEIENKVVADCGASTGGFTDYLLQNGAKKSYCLDVGHDQLDPSLKADSRVVNIEGINLKNPLELPEKVDLAVADLSFISLRLVLPTIRSLLKEGGEMVVLFKPQFEVGKENVGKNGVVKNEKIRQKTLEDFKAWCQENSLKVKGMMKSPIAGKRGNREFLIWIQI